MLPLRDNVSVEAAVAERLEGGDLTGAATTILRAYGPGILGFLVAITRNDGDAAEVYSAFTEDLWNGLHGFRREASAKLWAYKLAWHAAMRFFKQPHRTRCCRLRTSRVENVPAPRSGVSSARRRMAREELLARLRDELDLEDQTLLILRLDRKLAWRDVAEVLSNGAAPVDPATVRKRFERIKARLAARLRRSSDG